MKEQDFAITDGRVTLLSVPGGAARIEAGNEGYAISWSTEHGGSDILYDLQSMLGNVALDYNSELIFEDGAYDKHVNSLSQAISAVSDNSTNPVILLLQTPNFLTYWHNSYIDAIGYHEVTIAGEYEKFNHHFFETILDKTASSQVLKNKTTVLYKAGYLLDKLN
jgi:hypothetical protein